MIKPPVDKERTGVKAIPVEFNDEEIAGYGIPGSVEFKGDYLILACPGCGHVSGMLVGNPKPKAKPSWHLVCGSPQELTTATLSPSINCVGCCGWHGWLKNGVFESV